MLEPNTSILLLKPAQFGFGLQLNGTIFGGLAACGPNW